MSSDILIDTETDPKSRRMVLGPWKCSSHSPHTTPSPSEISNSKREEIPASVPGTVASALQAAGLWSFEHPPEIDTQDWWYRTTFPSPQDSNIGTFPDVSSRCFLCFEGLASLVEIWVNGSLLLTTENMFRRYRVEVSQHLKHDNELAICFRSVTEDLKRKRPRPKWKTNLVNQQQIRWIRTSLQGRIPGWSSSAPAIGPWKEIFLESSPVILEDYHLNPCLVHNDGLVSISAKILTLTSDMTAEFQVGDVRDAVKLTPVDGGYLLEGKLKIPQATLWWPHTHGNPYLYEAKLVCHSRHGNQIFTLPRVGFRRIEATLDPGFGLRLNSRELFCRGACWTLSDSLSLSGRAETLRNDLTLARDAGVNLLRVGGTMVYESDQFYELCDELGILVWQDFMFANMDYPIDQPDFHTNILAEVREQLQRFSSHPCLAVYCGNSEVQQQAAMLGMPGDVWSNHWYDDELPSICEQLHPGVPYLSSTPCGGTLPFHTHTGVTHYYGIGAYLRPRTDVRLSDVKFTPETLGFSNIPEPEMVDAIMQGGRTALHEPRWKSRVPRDTGAGWDFEDVRDHYLRELYGVDPVTLRSADTPRYLQLSRTVPGEMMTQAFSEWRSTHSRCQGGLVWFFKDLWPAAGWGIIDSTGTPKSAYYSLKRAWQTRQLTITDEGLNGLHLHLNNESSEDLSGSLEITLLKEPNRFVARNRQTVILPCGSKRTLSANEILGGFYDVSYAYRFGPAHHDVVIATWYDFKENILSQAFHFIGHRKALTSAPDGVVTSITQVERDLYSLRIRSKNFLHAVRVSAKSYLPTDNYFHLPPDQEKTVYFRAKGSVEQFRGEIEALNLEQTFFSFSPPA